MVQLSRLPARTHRGTVAGGEAIKLLNRYLRRAEGRCGAVNKGKVEATHTCRRGRQLVKIRGQQRVILFMT